MTNKECVGHLKKLKLGIVYINNLVPNEADKDKIDLEALDLAIKALEGRPKGEWIPKKDYDGIAYWKCSECKVLTSTRGNFCPVCGADMRKEAENE